MGKPLFLWVLFLGMGAVGAETSADFEKVLAGRWEVSGRFCERGRVFDPETAQVRVLEFDGMGTAEVFSRVNMSMEKSCTMFIKTSYSIDGMILGMSNAIEEIEFPDCPIVNEVVKGMVQVANQSMGSKFFVDDADFEIIDNGDRLRIFSSGSYEECGGSGIIVDYVRVKE